MRADLLDIEIRAGRIAGLRRPGERIRSVPRVDVRGCVILPGLINAHDHLEFNLFPRLGRGPYPDARAWARDIYHPKQSPVRDHLRVPPPVRLRWGGIKNLLSGVTTVCHHNPYEARVFEREFPVRVRNTSAGHIPSNGARISRSASGRRRSIGPSFSIWRSRKTGTGRGRYFSSTREALSTNAPFWFMGSD